MLIFDGFAHKIVESSSRFHLAMINKEFIGTFQNKMKFLGIFTSDFQVLTWKIFYYVDSWKTFCLSLEDFLWKSAWTRRRWLYKSLFTQKWAQIASSKHVPYLDAIVWVLWIADLKTKRTAYQLWEFIKNASEAG